MLHHLSGQQDKIISAFLSAFFVFIFATFFCPFYSIYLIIFYLFLLPSGIVLLYVERPSWLKNPTLVIIYVFFVYSSLTLLFNVQEDPRWCLELLKKTLITLLFLWLAIRFFSEEGITKKYITCSIIFGFIGSIVSLVWFFYKQYNYRLAPIGQMHQEILGAIIYGVFVLMAIYRLFVVSYIKAKLFYAAAAFSMMLLIIFTHSKGPIIACALSCFLLIMVLLETKGRIIFLSIVCVAVCGLLYICFETDWLHSPLGHNSYIEDIKQRGMSYRPQIWAYTLEQIKLHPLFGYGLGKHFLFQAEVDFAIGHPHNLYLATLYYTGIVGFILEMLIFWSIARNVWRDTDVRWKKFAGVLIVYLMLSMASDVVRLITGPKEMLFVFWMPVSMLLARAIKQQNTQNQDAYT